MHFKSAVKTGFFDMQRHLKWYVRRTNNDFNKDLINKFIEVQALLLAPFCPHTCEEMWEKIGKKGFISNAKWPSFDKSKIDPDSEAGEEIIAQLIADMNSVLKLAKIGKPSKFKLIISHPWKYKLFGVLKKELEKTRDFKEILKKVMTGDLKQYGKEITKMLPKFIKGGVPAFVSAKFEEKLLNDSKKFFENEFNCKVEIVKAQDSKEAKANNAMPGKPAIIVS